MDIRNIKQLKTFARERLSQTPAEKKIVMLYAGIALGLSALVMLLQFLLDLQINQSGGLGNMGLRSILSAVQTMLPFAQMGVSMCLGLGYLAAMLRIARGQYVSPKTLRLGFDRFWPLLRLTLLEGLLYSGVALVSLYLATAIFLITPLSDPVMELLMPFVSQMTVNTTSLMLDEVIYGQLMAAMWKVFLIWGVTLCILSVPLMFRYRMAQYVLIDRPALGALAALRESRKMMRRNCLNLLRLDLGLWWYYAAVMAISVIGYGDQLLPLLGVELPWSAAGSYYLFYGLYLLLQFGLCFALRNRVEVSYALAYDAIRPQDKQEGGVVLGNIFNM